MVESDIFADLRRKQFLLSRVVVGRFWMSADFQICYQEMEAKQFPLGFQPFFEMKVTCDVLYGGVFLFTREMFGIVLRVLS